MSQMLWLIIVALFLLGVILHDGQNDPPDHTSSGSSDHSQH
ncbi:hypothetical protein [Paenibacillus aestuarii]|uniref:Uncharacterized protein n=1 Tax=Paenibacillus aestuarii TaxID=516965 RepID=A0ABW0KEF1_9BACL|nr:hypothetical protein [Paenibacillus aestuarii]